MSNAEDVIKEIEAALATEKTLAHIKNPLDDERLIRRIKPSAWLSMKRGKAFLEDDQKCLARVSELMSKIDRKRGRPRKEKPIPGPIGRPRHDEYAKTFLRKLGEADRSEKYWSWLKSNGKRNCDKSKILYILELLIAAEGKKNVKSEARRELRTHQNMISRARQLSRKTPE